MKEKILLKATDMFLTFGFKSVTMDDIANELGISKKTIYTHFKNKTVLIEATSLHVFECITKGIDEIVALSKNPIEELFEIRTFMMEHLKNEKTSPQYQLQKYYPKIYQNLKKKQFDVMLGCVYDNLKRGVEVGLYRKELDLDFITRIYFIGVTGIKDQEVFPIENFKANHILKNYIEYHLRGIVSSKGLETLNKLLSKNEK